MATSASELTNFIDDIDEKVLECSICLKRLTNPKSLKCLHSFCLTCLDDWVKTNGNKLICPTCSTSYPIPKGGVRKLQPNTLLNNLLKLIEQFSGRDQGATTLQNQIKCICGKIPQKDYCPECKEYLCFTCSDHHIQFRLFKDHKLHSIENVLSMSPLQFASLHPPMCLVHSKHLEFYCNDCKIPICAICKIADHKGHKPISITEAFNTFKEYSKTAKESAQVFRKGLQDTLKEVIHNATELEQSKDRCLGDIDNHVQEMVNTIQNNGEKVKNSVKTNYTKKKAGTDVHMNTLRTAISYINTTLRFLDHTLTLNEATVMQSRDQAINAVSAAVWNSKNVPAQLSEPDGETYFYKNQQQIALLQQCDIGYVSRRMTADCLAYKEHEEFITQGKRIVVKVIKTDKCEIDSNQLKATWTHPTGETNITQVEEDENGDYIVTGECTSPGDYELNVSVVTDNKDIKQSPKKFRVKKNNFCSNIYIPSAAILLCVVFLYMMGLRDQPININTEGLVNTIEVRGNIIFRFLYGVTNVSDVVKCEGDCLLVSIGTNIVYNYTQSGKCMYAITLPPGVRVNRMYKMKNGNLAFSDLHDRCIKVCNMNGKVLKSIGEGLLNDPDGIEVNNALNEVYVADGKWLFMFDVDSGKFKGKLERPFTFKFTIIKELVTVFDIANRQLVRADIENVSFNRVGRVSDPSSSKSHAKAMVYDDVYDNLIILSDDKLELFRSDGTFIKRIDKLEDGLKNPQGLTIIKLQRVAVANGDGTVKIFNY